MKNFILLLVIISCFMAAPGFLSAQEDSAVLVIKKPGNVLMIAIQPALFRLNYYDPDFFNNPDFKPGIDLCFQYGKTLGKSWMVKTGTDLSFSPGKFLIGQFKDKKYINESFLRVPLTLTKKFPIDCNDCFMSPSLFVEFGGYAAMSLYQSTYIQDAPTGLSSLDNKISFGYMKAGIAGGLGLSFLSNNFGRHVLGVRVYNDQSEAFEINKNKITAFKPSYTSVAVFYNIANISW